MILTNGYKTRGSTGGQLKSDLHTNAQQRFCTNAQHRKYTNSQMHNNVNTQINNVTEKHFANHFTLPCPNEACAKMYKCTTTLTQMYNNESAQFRKCKQMHKCTTKLPVHFNSSLLLLHHHGACTKRNMPKNENITS